MIYHYFGNKEGLYLAALERVYGVMRQREAELDLRELPPVEAIQKLVVFAFDHMAENKDFVKLVIAENLQRGRFLKKSKTVSKASTDLLKMISEVLENGAKQGVFRPDVDALQLYVSIISLGFTHLSNQHTLSITYQEDLAAKDWLAARREHVLQMVLDYLRP
jgi:TetR/AcrR family transcriptional regulator